MDCITAGFPVPHSLPEFVQNHVLWVGDAIQQWDSILKLAELYNNPSDQWRWLLDDLSNIY